MNISFLTDKTRNVFEILAKDKFIADYSLVGGTALSVQLEHRLSEDLDFIFYGEYLNVTRIKRFINHKFPQKYRLLKEDGKYQIDFLVNDVKVTFFSTGSVIIPFDVKQYTNKYKYINIAESKIIAVLKLCAISQRNTIKDYYDLYYITKHVLSLRELFILTKQLIPNIAPITYSETIIYVDDLIENSISNHLKPEVNINKRDISQFFIDELKKINE